MKTLKTIIAGLAVILFTTSAFTNSSAEAYLGEKESAWYNIPRGVTGAIVNPISGSTTDLSVKDLMFYVKGTEPDYVKEY